MQELALQGEIEREDIFEFVINNIKYSITNKVIFHAGKSVSEFKEKLKNYENMRGNLNKSQYFSEVKHIKKISYRQKDEDR